MKLTSKQLRQIIKEELNKVLNEERDTITRLSDYITKGNKEDLFHGIELLKAAELEPWHRAELHSAINTHLVEIQKDIRSYEQDLQELENESRSPTPRVTYKELFSHMREAEGKLAELEIQAKELEDLLSNFKVNDMVYLDDPTME